MYENLKTDTFFFDIKYVDNEGNSQIAEVKAVTHAEAASEFHTCWAGQFKERGEIKKREIPTVPVLVA